MTSQSTSVMKMSMNNEGTRSGCKGHRGDGPLPPGGHQVVITTTLLGHVCVLTVSLSS